MSQLTCEESRCTSRPSLLVDYSLKCSAKSRVPLTHSVFRMRRSKQLDSIVKNQLDAAGIHVNASSEITTIGGRPSPPVYFQLRRSLADRNNFLTFLKLHRSESELDLQTASETDMVLHKRLQLQQLSQSCHTLSDLDDRKDKRFRRDSLKKALLRTKSSKSLCPYPLSPDPPISMLPSRTFLDDVPYCNTAATPSAVSKTRPPVPNLPKRTSCGSRRRALKSLSPDVALTRRSVPTFPKRTSGRRNALSFSTEAALLRPPLATALGEKREKEEERSYIPLSLRTNRRTMMQKQSSFVTGSRIRTLRASTQ